MYLADRELKALLPELRIETSHPGHRFLPSEQIQPCSVDLRVSNYFWKPSRRRRRWRRWPWQPPPAVDLRAAHVHELDARRDWRPFVLDEGDVETIKPGQILMGRVYERFEVPRSCAGKIEGRSSYARLGLFVHSTGDFINPGWGGYMPLQLFNAGPYPIRITPFLPICQLKLVRLTSEPERAYGQDELGSKYVNDDGGPSFWWRDQTVRALQARLGEVHMPQRVVDSIVNLVRFEDPELLARLVSYVNRQRIGRLENADRLLDHFARLEDWRKMRDSLLLGVFPVFFSASIGSLFVRPVGALHFVLWALTLVSAGVSAYALGRRDTDYLTKRELRAARAGHAREHAKG